MITLFASQRGYKATAHIVIEVTAVVKLLGMAHRDIRNQVVAGHSVARGRQGAIADTCVEPIAMHSQFLGQATYRHDLAG